MIGQLGQPRNGFTKYSLLSVSFGLQEIESGYCFFSGNCQSAYIAQSYYQRIIKASELDTKRKHKVKQQSKIKHNLAQSIRLILIGLRQQSYLKKVKEMQSVGINRPKSFSKFSFLLLISIILLLQSVSTFSDIKLINIVDNEFQKTFLIQQKSNHLFLTLSCKQRNMLSILISKELNYQVAPRFNIFGNHHNVPNMGSSNHTFFDQCPISIELNSSNYLINILRKKSSFTLMSIDQISFKQLHHQFVVKDSSQKWGLGERFQSHFDIKDGKWTIYNRDKPWKIDHGSISFSDQTYGHHPVYLARQRSSKLYHLVYFRNTHGMLIDSSDNSDKLVFNTIGGNIHLIVVIGGLDPQAVIEQYHSFIGGSHIPPFWSLGFHQSRWGYHTLAHIEQVVTKYQEHSLPLDCVWADLDYMKDKRIFTVDEAKYPPKDLNSFIKSQQIHFVPLLDVAIATEDEEAVDTGKQLNVFLKDHLIEDQQYVGEVWPGKVYYIDYLHPNASLFWYSQLERLNDKINFSGIWLDMNEPTNFKGGRETKETIRIQHIQNINTMTIDADLCHYSSNQEKLLHREVHSYYGHLSIVPTFEYLQKESRPFIISRSTSVGSGMFGGHWTGDNVANWEFLRLSISGNFLFQIFGIQMVGADICGFYKDTSQQLCSRWMQLGSFYPFARNHNHEKAVSQEPYEFGQILLATSLYSLHTRYSLLKQIYTFMVLKKGIGSIFRPLSFQFYEDENVYDEQTIQTQFLMGKSLMVAPIVYQNDESRYVYFPGEEQVWYKFQIDIHSGRVVEKKIEFYVGSTSEAIENILPSPPLTFLRGGFMLFSNRPALRAHKLSNHFNILATLRNDKSQGQIMGIKDYQNQAHLQKCIKEGCFYRITITKLKDSFHLEWHFEGDSLLIGLIHIQNIVLASKTMKWKHTERITINSAQGSLLFVPKNVVII